MGIRRRYKNFIEKFLSGEQGKRFFHVTYSLGAAIVIIGALAKITYWPWGLGNILLTVGLLTESIIFIISAFDRPSKDYQWEKVYPELENGEARENAAGIRVEGGGIGGGTVVIGGGSGGGYSSAVESVENMTVGQVRQSFGIPNAVDISEEDNNALTASIKKMAAAADQLSKMAEMTDATQQYLDQLTSMSDDMKRFSSVTNNLTDVSDILLGSYKSITDNSDGINQSSRGYVQQMEALNRNIQGLNTIYEIQLKSISSQIDAIERINSGLMRIKDLYDGSIVDSSVFRSETEKMAQQLQQLNGVYSRLLNAMTVNMYAHPAYPPAGSYPNPQQQL
jgi:gliding motility-associated protein GldL